MHRQCLYGPINSYHSFLWSNLILCLYNVDTLNICMKEFLIFVCRDSTEIFLSKLRSPCSNYKLPSFFTDSYCVGVSNKHCLLTFFIFVQTSQECSLDDLARLQFFCIYLQAE